MLNESILERNIAELQLQLQEAYIHINELTEVKNAAQKVVDASTKLSEYAHYNTDLMRLQDEAIWELKNKL